MKIESERDIPNIHTRMSIGLKYTPEIVKQIHAKHPNKRFFRAVKAAECIVEKSGVPTIANNGKGANKATNTPAVKPNTWYVPIQTLTLDGTYVHNVNFTMSKQLFAGGAKVQPTFTPETAKYITVSMRKLNDEDLATSMYPKNKHADLLKQNDECIEMLNFIADELYALLDDMRINHADYGANKPKDEIHSFCQEVIKNVTTGQETQLTNPIYRFRVDIDRQSRQLGRGFTTGGQWQFNPIVYDAKKKDKKGSPMAATVDNPETKTSEPLTAANCQHYLTYMSLFSADFSARQAIIFKDGLSAPINIHKAYVYSHPRRQNTVAVPDDLDEFVREDVRPDNVEDIDSDALVIDDATQIHTAGVPDPLQA